MASVEVGCCTEEEDEAGAADLEGRVEEEEMGSERDEGRRHDGIPGEPMYPPPPCL